MTQKHTPPLAGEAAALPGVWLLPLLATDAALAAIVALLTIWEGVCR